MTLTKSIADAITATGSYDATKQAKAALGAVLRHLLNPTSSMTDDVRDSIWVYRDSHKGEPEPRRLLYDLAYLIAAEEEIDLPVIGKKASASAR